MKKLTATLALLAVLCGLTAGCNSGPDCVAVCEKSSACGEADAVDCATVCDDKKAENEAAGCETEYDDYLSCIDALPDACAVAVDACSTPSAAYSECLAAP